MQKVLPNKNYKIRRINTNKTQITQCIRLKTFVPNEPLEDSFREERLQPNEEIIIPQDDFYIKLWKTNIGEQLATRGNGPIPTSLQNGEQPITSNVDTNYADEKEVDYIIGNDSPNVVNDDAQQRNERLKDDVSKRNEYFEAERNDNSDWPNSAVYPKNQEISSPDLSERQKSDAKFVKENSSIENDAQNSPKKGDDIIVSEISQNEDRNERVSPRGRK